VTTLLREYPNFDLRIEYTYSPGTPDQTRGPPEACYEGDPEEFELESVTLLYMDSELVLRAADLTALGFMSELCEDMNEKIEEWCREDWEAQQEAALEEAAIARWEASHD
jgi:hypothetical protein